MSPTESDGATAEGPDALSDAADRAVGKIEEAALAARELVERAREELAQLRAQEAEVRSRLGALTTDMAISAMPYVAEIASPAVLVIDDEEPIRRLVVRILRGAGFDAIAAAGAVDAFQRLEEALPDVIVCDVMMPGVDGLSLVQRLRQDPKTEPIPVIYLTSLDQEDDVVRGLSSGADDYLTKPFRPDELVARVRAKVARPSIPASLLPMDRRTGLLSLGSLTMKVERALHQGLEGTVAQVRLYEESIISERLGRRAVDQLMKQVGEAIAAEAEPGWATAVADRGSFAIFLPGVGGSQGDDVLRRLISRLASRRFVASGEAVTVTPVVGFAPLDPHSDPERILEEAGVAARAAGIHLDLTPVAFDPSMTAAVSEQAPSRLKEALRLPFQITATLLVSFLVPYLIYRWLFSVGVDVTKVLYLVIVVSLVMTALTIWAEGFAAKRPTEPPGPPAEPMPPASAIIAAYLPNEAATIMETIEAFLRLDYPGPIQVILAYNSPSELPIEARLRELAARDSRFVPFKVTQSTSKAQNVNFALPIVTGQFVGVFDADHHPQADSFVRAWAWLSNGYDVVQGHNVVRNGDESSIAKTVAVEFEAIYAVSHPGRARLHGFGIFGGSNGYWKTDLLRQIRMRGSMLTEDIDSSLRAIESGHKIASDRNLLSFELGPVTLQALWNQRMRWAQGWFQVSLRHVTSAFGSKELTLRNKIGLFYLLAWREVYPWISVQMFPLIAFWAWRYGGLDKLDWMIPIFVVTTIFTLGTGPAQTIMSYRLAHPSIRRNKAWFWRYLLVTTLYYTELKNLITRVSQIKEFLKERAWKVTPRG